MSVSRPIYFTVISTKSIVRDISEFYFSNEKSHLWGVTILQNLWRDRYIVNSLWHGHLWDRHLVTVLEGCPSYRESKKGSKERQGPTLDVWHSYHSYHSYLSYNGHVYKTDTCKTDTWSWSLSFFDHSIWLSMGRSSFYEGHLVPVPKVPVLERTDCTPRQEGFNVGTVSTFIGWIVTCYCLVTECRIQRNMSWIFWLKTWDDQIFFLSWTLNEKVKEHC